jgi:TAP-like protein
VTLDEPGLFEILGAGDLNPALRALLPAAIVSALDHDPDPLLRLKALAEGLIPTIPSKPPQEGESSVDETLYVDTSCEETLFPWQRTASAQTRQAEALAALRALPHSDFSPFDPATALDASLVPTCVDWPAAAPAPPPTGPLPNVPTLILSGAQDLRTPTANARRLAAEIPDAQVLVVPFTGHSVLGADFSGCAEQAVQDFFSAVPVQQCPPTKDVFAPTPVTPTKLSSIRAPAVLGGRPGQTLTATLDTILDLERQVTAATLQVDAELPAGSSFGGLRGGYARLDSSAVVLDGFSFVPGVELSGSFPIRFGELQPGTLLVGGSLAASGTIRLTLGRTASGTLGGKSFDVELAKVKLARASGAAGQWPTGTIGFPLAGLARVR